jgi:arylsulfatase A-like enzyme
VGDCSFGHRGVLVDLGDAVSHARLPATDHTGRLESVERDGASWARILARDVGIPFVATADDVAASTLDGATPGVEVRIRAGSARSVAVFLNGKAVGSAPLQKGDTQILSLKLPTEGANAPQLVPGSNEILLRFRGAAKAGASALDEEAEIDWVHVGGVKNDEAYAAPTRVDAVSSVSLAGVPVRAISLRAPGYARCIGWLPSSGHLTTSVGVAGTGDADLELRVVRDRGAPVVLAAMHVAGEAPWKAVDVPLVAHSGSAGAPGTLGAIELVAVRSTKGARVLFGEPRVIAAGGADAVPEHPEPPVNGVVLVVLGDAAPRLFEPFTAGATPLPELTALAKSSVLFDGHRSTGGYGSTAVASMLTALSPREHGVVEEDSGLAPDVTTLADVARQAGIRAGMFTGVPTTGSAFGFGRGWDAFVEHPPDLGDAPGASTQPFDDAARWITDRATPGVRFLAVVHARGGHPPWDATPEEMRNLPPRDYSGGIDPKRAAELLSRARPQSGPGQRLPALRLNDADRTRAWALYALALGDQDAAFGRLMASLKSAGRDADTMIIVTGDVGLGEARAPLEDPDTLGESALATPLLVRFPPQPAGNGGEPLAGRRVALPTTSADVARTVVAAFGLTPPAAFGGEDLARVAVATDHVDPRGRPMLAVAGTHFALRWGTFVLRGIQPDAPPGQGLVDVTKFCDLSLEPECTSDVRGAFPLALAALRRELSTEAKPPRPPTPVVETPGVRGALRLWGM